MSTAAHATMMDAGELIRKADRKRHNIFKRGPAKYEAAAELYARAGKLLRGNGCDTEASEAFRLASECHAKAKQEYEAGTALVSAANCLRGADSPRAARCLRLSGQHFEKAGRMSAAAKHLQEAGELYDSGGDSDDALECFERAAGHFGAEKAPGHATTCIAKVGSIRAQRGEYGAAIEALERAAREALSSDLLRHSARDYLFRAFLCAVATGNCSMAAANLDRYCEMDTSFRSSRDVTFARHFLAGVEAKDLGTISDAVGDYQEVSRFPLWHTRIIANIRKAVEIDVGVAQMAAKSSSSSSSSTTSPQPASPIV
jgi:alpha-soluble NSF attachment protein